MALRAALGSRVVLIHQDYVRRELLHDVDPRRRSRDASVLIVGTARQALDLGYDVIQPLPWYAEHRVGPETTTDELVSLILSELDQPGTTELIYPDDTPS